MSKRKVVAKLDEEELRQAIRLWMDTKYPWLEGDYRLEWLIYGDIFKSVELEIIEPAAPKSNVGDDGENS